MVDLKHQTVNASGKSYPFKIDSFCRHCMLNWLDSIGLTLQREADISCFEAQQPAFLH